MPFDASPVSAAPLALHHVDEAVRIVREVRGRLGDLAAQATHIADDSDWHSPSARAFHEGLERWGDRLAKAQGYAEEAVDALQRARADVSARAWLP
jgi:hypothetical protein